MATARRIPVADRWSKGPEFTKYTNMIHLGRKIAGATLGIVGMGEIPTFLDAHVQWRNTDTYA